MDNPEDLAHRLNVGLEKLAARGEGASSASEAQVFAELANNLTQHLAAMPDETRRLIHTADSGFASSGKWVDDAIETQNQKIKKLARAAKMVATWLGQDGKEAERVFIIRGNIRGWAHRWRKEDRGPAQVDSDHEFVSFASDCLTKADISGNHEALIEKALGSDWRTAPD